MQERHPNRLAGEASPYLQQHAHNPVDWYPWGPEPLARAKADNKPILLSVGYSACHWCHVMAHECFENERIAAQMNEGFVNIKVDREERPDIDEVYQRVTQLITGQGGWPLTVFLDPDLRPIYGGTYFPPRDAHGRPGFPRVMHAVLDAFRNRPQEAEQGAREMVERMRLIDTIEPGTHVPGAEAFAAAEGILSQNFDSVNGGFGTAPKFPMVADHEFLLARHRATGKAELRDMVLYSLEKMASGGIYDQLGGGFHRYSVDAQWLAPHFEKMLYDNALIPRLYLEAYRLTGNPEHARIVHESIGYLLREMRSPEGAFYSSQDADSEGVEGKYFVWTAAEVRDVLGAARAEPFAKVYDVSDHGNWEGKNILRIVERPEQVAQKLGIPVDTLREDLREDARKLLAARERRVKPGRDDKHIAAWNGLAVSLFARAGDLLEREDYLDAARDCARFLLWRMHDSDSGALLRIYQTEAKITGFLDDYAYVSAGLLDLHRATGEPEWAVGARKLLDRVLERFVGANGLLYLTDAQSDALPSRPRSGYDQMLPSPAAVAVQGLWRLWVLTGDDRYRTTAEKTLITYGDEVERHPTAFAGMLASIDLYHRGDTTCVITGEADGADRLARAARKLLPPDEAIVLAEKADGVGTHLVEGKGTPDGTPAAYICHGYTCMPAAQTPDELADRLQR